MHFPLFMLANCTQQKDRGVNPTVLTTYFGLLSIIAILESSCNLAFSVVAMPAWGSILLSQSAVHAQNDVDASATVTSKLHALA